MWVLFLLGRGYSLAQVGIAEGVYHITSMIFEVPSGMAADLLGRRRTLIFSGIAGMCSGLCMTLDGWSGWIYCGMIFSALSINLASGTQEAITYDSLLQANCAGQYKTIRANISIIGRVLSALSCTLSPVAIALGYRYTYIFTIFLNLCGSLTAAGLKEPMVTEEQYLRDSYGFREIGSRLKNHISETFLFIKKHPRTICKLFANAAVACPCYLIMMYLQEHLVNCGWPVQWIGIPMLLIPLSGAVGSWIASRSRTKPLKAVVLGGLLGGIGTCLSGSYLLAVTLLGACIARTCEGFCEIIISENVNHDFSSDQRATLISIDSMLYSVLMVIASPLTGFLGSHYSIPVIFYTLGGILFLSTGILGGFLHLMRRRLR